MNRLRTRIQGRWKGVSGFQALSGGLAVASLIGMLIMGGVGWVADWQGGYIAAGGFMLLTIMQTVIHFQAPKRERQIMRRFYRANTSQIILNIAESDDVIVMAGPQLILATIEKPATKVSTVGNTSNLLADGKPIGQADQHRAVRVAKTLSKIVNGEPVAVAVFPGMEGNPMSIPLTKGGALIICSDMDLAGIPSVTPPVITLQDAQKLAEILPQTGLPKLDPSQRRGKSGLKRKKRSKSRK